MKAVVLAGGRGTRLMPYTTVLPKPLLPVGDKPILEIIVRQLAYYGFRDVVLAVGHLAELIQAYFGRGWDPGTRISFVREREPLGTAGALRLVPDLDDTFLVMNGDILTSLDYTKMVAFHHERESVLTVGVYERRERIESGVVSMDGEGRLTRYDEKPETVYAVSIGVYVCEPTVLRYIEPSTYLDVPELVRRLLANGHKVMGYQCRDYWVDVGHSPDHARACEEFERRKEAFLPSQGRVGQGPTDG